MNEVRSPDGQLIATESLKNCGAASPYMTEVSLRRAEELFGERWEPILQYRGEHPVALNWLGPRELRIQLLIGIQPMKRIPTWRDVRITYAEVSSIQSSAALKKVGP